MVKIKQKKNLTKKKETKKEKKIKRRKYILKAAKKVTYKDVNLLKIFLTRQGKILPRKITGLTAQQQKKISKAVKHARILALLPFLSSNYISY